MTLELLYGAVEKMNAMKARLLLRGLGTVIKVSEMNSIPAPLFRLNTKMRAAGLYSAIPTEGYWLIQINTKLCRVPIASSASYTWPRYTVDMTPYGVLCHEFGHHWHRTHPEYKRITHVFRSIRRADIEPAVTDYAKTNTHEDIAESVRVFVLNPDLLRVLNPFRWAALKKFGLKPLETRPWAEILEEEGAPERFAYAIRNKAKRFNIQ